MPFLPELPQWEKSVINTQQFLGLNRGLSIGDGEMADMLNMSGDNYPVLSTRHKRGLPSFHHSATLTADLTGQVDGMLGTDKLIVCHEGKVYMDGGWLIVRFSGTEPRVRIFAEAPTMEEAKGLVGGMAGFLNLPFKG